MVKVLKFPFLIVIMSIEMMDMEKMSFYKTVDDFWHDIGFMLETIEMGKMSFN